MDELSVNAWQTELLRFTVFTEKPVGNLPQDESWWRQVTGAEPESQTIRPIPGDFRNDGGIEGYVYRLTLSVTLNRIDWILYSQEQEPMTFPMIGLYHEVLDFFIGIIRPWIKNYCPPCTRLALGATLLQPVADKVTAYKLLQRYLPHISIDAELSSDFFYQINRPTKELDGTEIYINRLSKWNAISMNLHQFTPNGAASINSLRQTACRLELDISTPADRIDALAPEYYGLMLTYFQQYSLDTALSGDIFK